MLGDLAGCQPARALLHQASEYFETCFLCQSCERANRFRCFHISMIIEIMNKVKRASQYLKRLEGRLVDRRSVGRLRHAAAQVAHKAVL